MPSLPAELDFALNPDASPARMNLAMQSIDQRLRALELPAKQFDQVLAQLTQIGLERINDALQPYYQALTSIVSLGVLFEASSTTRVQIPTDPSGLGTVAFTLSDADKDRFATAGYLVAVSQTDSRNALSGRTNSYDRPSGVLKLDVMIASGSGAPNDWLIMPTVPPFVPAAVIDPGTDAANAIAAVPYVPLPVAATTAQAFDPGLA